MPIQAPQWTDYLNCPACCREFAPPRSPVSLGCGHTLCRLCLKNLHRKQCPFDQTVISVDVEELVVNTALLQLAGYTPPAQPFHPPCIQALPNQDKHAYDVIVKCLEQLAVFLKYCGNAGVNMAGSRLSRPMQRKLVTLLQCAIIDEEGRGKAARAARSLGERTVTELILQHQNPQQLSANLWAAVRSRGCQFLGPAMQEEVLKLVLLALEDGSALSRKVLVMFVVQRLEPHFPQASKTSIGHVVQLLYRASCFKVSKRESDSSLMQLKEEFRTYESLRREHDAQIVQIATEAGLRIAPDQWSALLYGDTQHKSHMQSIIDKLQTPQSFAQSVQELFIALQRTGDPAQLIVMSVPLDRLANIDASPDAKSPSWQQLAEIMTSLKEVVSGLVQYMQHQSSGREASHVPKVPDRQQEPLAQPPTMQSGMVPGRYKVAMCRDAQTRTYCPRGNNCTYAHSEEELERYRQFNAPGNGNNFQYLLPVMPPPPIVIPRPLYSRFSVPPPPLPNMDNNYNMQPMQQQMSPSPRRSVIVAEASERERSFEREQPYDHIEQREPQYEHGENRFQQREQHYQQRESQYELRDRQYNHRDKQYEQMEPQHYRRDTQYEHMEPQHYRRDAQYDHVEPQHNRRDAQYDHVEPQHNRRDAQYDHVEPQHNRRDAQYDQMEPQHNRRDAQYDQMEPQHNRRDAQHEQMEPQIIRQDTRYNHDHRDKQYERMEHQLNRRDTPYERHANQFERREPEYQRPETQYEQQRLQYEHHNPQYELSDAQFKYRDSQYVHHQRQYGHELKYERSAPQYEQLDTQYEIREPKYELLTPQYEVREPQYELHEPQYDQLDTQYEIREQHYDHHPQYEQRERLYQRRVTKSDDCKKQDHAEQSYEHSRLKVNVDNYGGSYANAVMYGGSEVVTNQNSQHHPDGNIDEMLSPPGPFYPRYVTGQAPYPYMQQNDILQKSTAEHRPTPNMTTTNGLESLPSTSRRFWTSGGSSPSGSVNNEEMLQYSGMAGGIGDASHANYPQSYTNGNGAEMLFDSLAFGLTAPRMGAMDPPQEPAWPTNNTTVKRVSSFVFNETAKNLPRMDGVEISKNTPISMEMGKNMKIGMRMETKVSIGIETTNNLSLGNDLPTSSNPPVVNDLPVGSNLPVGNNLPIGNNLPVINLPIGSDLPIGKDEPVGSDLSIGKTQPIGNNPLPIGMPKTNGHQTHVGMKMKTKPPTETEKSDNQQLEQELQALEDRICSELCKGDLADSTVQK